MLFKISQILLDTSFQKSAEMNIIFIQTNCLKFCLLSKLFKKLNKLQILT